MGEEHLGMAHERLCADLRDASEERERASRGCSAARAVRHLLQGLGLLALFAFVLSLGMPAPAEAGQNRLVEPFSPLKGSGSGVTIHRPSGIAIDEATGNVFLTDENGSADAILILNGEDGKDGEAKAPIGLAPTGGEYKITGVTTSTSPQALAFDNSESSAKGTLYFFQAAAVRKFVRNPVTEEYEAAGQIAAPGASGAAGLTVDGEGNVYLGDFGSQKVRVWSPAGVLLHEYNLAASPTNRPSGLAVDGDGNLYVQRQGGGGVYRYPAAEAGGVDVSSPELVTSVNAAGVAYDPATDHILVSAANQVIELDAATLEQVAGYGEDTLGANPERLAINSASGRLYVADRTAGKLNVAVFSPLVPVPDVVTKAAPTVAGAVATLAGTVNPQGVGIVSCRFEYGPTTTYGTSVPCDGTLPIDSNTHEVTADVDGLEPNGTTYHYRLVVESDNGVVEGADRILTTAATASLDPASAITDSKATLSGIVRPEGAAVTECFFEYGTTRNYGSTAACVPGPGGIPDDFGSHVVTAELSGLPANTTLQYRLVVATTDWSTQTAGRSFRTLGPPRVVEQVPMNVGEDRARLQATINPSGSPTTYLIEWGSDDFSHRIPVDHELSIGGGGEPTTVAAEVTGLAPETRYRFRVVARNAFGRTEGPAQTFETLGRCGLTLGRCFELVSPPDVGAVGEPGGPVALRANLQMQVAPDGSRIAYSIAYGASDASTGSEVLYASGLSDDGGWSTRQITPPALSSANQEGGGAHSGFDIYLSRDLECGFSASAQQLTADTPPPAVAAGVPMLFRHDGAGNFALVTDKMPINPEAGRPLQSAFEVVGAAPDCSRVYFITKLKYPGVEYTNESDARWLYEWHDGVLRNAAVVPGPGGSAEPVIGRAAAPGSGAFNRTNAVSQDGETLYFTAVHPVTGARALYRRTGTGPAEEISASENPSVPTRDVHFQTASKDGRRVFFLANYGITGDASNGTTTATCGNYGSQCDLYEYNVEREELVDLSATTASVNPAGAVVEGVLDISADGRHVYFATRGDLTGEGNTYAENQVGHGAYNVYHSEEIGPGMRQLSYVATVPDLPPPGGPAVVEPLSGPGLFASPRGNASEGSKAWAARATPDGRHLVFQSRGNVTGYDSGRIMQAYRYAASSQDVTCITCRRDGSPLARYEGPLRDTALFNQQNPLAGRDPSGRSDQAPPTVISEDGSRVVFKMADRLAPGGVDGEYNWYLWEQGQVTHLASRLAVQLAEPLTYLGADDDLTSLFIATPERLTWEDRDDRLSVFVARVGGGHAPPAPLQVCEPLTEASCQTANQPPPALVAPLSQALRGGGNVAAAGPQARCGAMAGRAKALQRRAQRLRKAAGRASSLRLERRLKARAERLAKAAKRARSRVKRCRHGAGKAGNANRGIEMSQSNTHRRAGK